MNIVEDTEKRRYYVYECEVEGVVRYIGKGCGNRLNHCISGASNVPELNRDFFAGKSMSVYKVSEDLTESDALALEAELIRDGRDTLYNVQMGTVFVQRQRTKPLYKKGLLNIEESDISKYKSKVKVPESNVKRIEEGLTEDSLSLRIREVDAKIKIIPAKIDYEFLVGLICNSELTRAETKLLVYISNNLAGWNYHVNMMRELCYNSGIDKFTISKTLRRLSPEILQIKHKDKPNKGCIVVKINPLIAWKGSLVYRDQAVESWYDSVENAKYIKTVGY